MRRTIFSDRRAFLNIFYAAQKSILVVEMTNKATEISIGSEKYWKFIQKQIGCFKGKSTT
jgi:hypothetical protein